MKIGQQLRKYYTETGDDTVQVRRLYGTRSPPILR